MSRIHSFLVSIREMLTDPIMAYGRRGRRYILSTQVKPEQEQQIHDTIWTSPPQGGQAQIVRTDELEVSYFNQEAWQDHHVHDLGHEIYIVLKGTMSIMVNGDTRELCRGDVIVILPGSRHKVLRYGYFLCVAIAIKPGGKADKRIIGQ